MMTMTKPRQLAFTTLFSGTMILAMTALAQDPAPPSDPTTQATTPPKKKNLRRSVVHHYRYPYPGHYHGDQTAGFRNPGGVGRYREYYPPGEQFDDGGVDPVQVAGFDRGGGAPDRAEQLQALQIGVQRQNSIQNSIDNYARPYVGYGVGYFGGYY